MKKKQQAFTLLELLVVISIMAILIALASASYVTAQKKSRDAKRRSDIKTVQTALEQYYAANNNKYPTSTAFDTKIQTVLPGGFPTDPRNSGSYVYTFNLAASGYCICATLENLAGGNVTALPSAGMIACNYGTPPSTATIQYYCLSNLQ